MDTTKLKSRLGDKVQELQKPTGEPNITVAPAADISLAPSDSSYIALTSNALDLIRANLKSQPLTLDLFDIVKSPSGGSTVFSVPGLAGDEAEKDLTGIILDYTTPRAYWDTPDPVEGTPPVCMSQNSIISHDGKACALCPFNDFGSKDGDSNAKACKESVLLFSSDHVASIVPDNKRLRAFTKLALMPGETREVRFTIPATDLAFVGADGRWTLEEGDFTLTVGQLSVPVRCTSTTTFPRPNI